mgnify:CR=1 FL=1
MPDSLSFEDYKKKRSGSAFIRRSFVRYFFLLIFLAFLYFVYSSFYYIDPGSQCKIKIKYDVLKGDRESIKDGLKRIKSEDYVLYKNICLYVDTIYEKRCLEPEEKSMRKLKYTDSKGCYIKGSKAIVINPVSEDNYEKVDIRVEAISKYGQMAIDYWVFGEDNIKNLEEEGAGKNVNADKKEEGTKTGVPKDAAVSPDKL